MKVIVTGTTGMVGKGVLIECLDHEDILEVLSISRRSVELDHPKLKELLHKDFSEFESVKDHLRGYDACYACMGVSAAGMKEDQYTKLTYDFTMSLANTLYSINPDMTYTYVSGQGTDTTERGRSMWGRVKGKTENDLLKLGFKQAYMFRPGGIIPVKGVSPSNKLYKNIIERMTWLIKLFKKAFPNSIVDTAQIGQAMINVTLKGYDEHIVNPADILKLSSKGYKGI